MMLTKCTLSQLKNGTIPLDKFDPAIRDAILVTRALEITYIWIDALCIFQDDKGKDWNEQSSKMNEIYGGSTLTLVVANSDSVTNGFLKERDLEYIPILWCGGQPGELASSEPSARVFLSPEWDKKHSEINGPWSTRGWTMQEGLLPNRLLYFKSSQMIWKCCEERKFERGVTESLQDVLDETLTYSDDITIDSGWIWKLGTFIVFKRLPEYMPISLNYPLLSAPAFRLWYDLIEDYTPRKFKYISDRLVAISGLAQIFGKMIRSQEYVAGLWKPDMIRGLLWHTEEAKLIPQRSGERMRAENNTFPSWSWASVGYERVKNSQMHDAHFQTLSRIEDVKIDVHNPFQPFGALSSRSITITGPLKKVSRLYNRDWKSVEEPMSELERHLSKITKNESSGSVDPRYSSPSGVHFAALQMLGEIHSEISLLVLESTGKVSNGHNEYYRVGVVTLRHISPSSIASPELVAKLAKYDESLTARLGAQRSQARKQETSNAVVTELRREPWNIETVVII
jgi:heterokaryon incompatibility protein (HET)